MQKNLFYKMYIRPIGRLFSTSALNFRDPKETDQLDTPVPEVPQEPLIQAPNINSIVARLNTLAMPDRPIQNTQERQNHTIAERLIGEPRERYEEATSTHYRQSELAERARIAQPQNSVF